MPTTTVSDAKVVRDPAFARRLEQACDANIHCPPMHKGRLVWLAAEMSKRLKSKVTVQTCARWMNGEAKPRQAKNIKLAELLGVDSTWLYLGIEQDLTPRERRFRNATADGAVNLIAGLIQMDGGYPAFPEEKDTRAVREHIDLYAVIKGANYSFHVTVGTKQGNEWSFVVPVETESVVILGVVREGFAMRIIEITNEIIEAHGTSRGRSMTVTMSEETLAEGQLKSFAQRL